MIVADTDVLIDFLAGSNPGFSRVRAAIDGGQLHTTTITQYELLAGANSPKQDGRIRDLLAALSILPLDRAAADLGARTRRDLERRGESVGMADSLIAGIVLACGGRLLTRNRRHFERVETLALVDLE